MTKKMLISFIRSKSVAKIKITIDDDLFESYKISCKEGNLILRSYKSYCEIENLLIGEGYKQLTDLCNQNKKMFILEAKD